MLMSWMLSPFCFEYAKLLIGIHSKIPYDMGTLRCYCWGMHSGDQAIQGMAFSMHKPWAN